jgi:spore germination protein KC
MDVVKALIGQGEVAISGIRIVGTVNVGGSKTNRDHSKLPTYIQIDGIALFKDKKLVKWLDGKEARGILWVRNKMKGTIVNVACKDKKEGTSIELIRSETKMKVNMVNGRPVFQIVIEEEGAVNEVHCPIDLSKHEEIAKLQDLWAEETEKEVIEAIKVAQGKKSDIFGFGEEVGRTYPKMWKKMKADWSELFAQGKIEVHAEAIIRRTGMRGKPHFINK